MKSYIPHRLLIINEHISENAEDENFMRSMQLAFDWANQMGLQGKKVSGLNLVKPHPDILNQRQSLWCIMECSEEEQELWNELKDLEIK